MTEPHEELQELQEQAEHGEKERSLAPVSLTMAVLAVGLAITTLLGHRTHTEEILLQTRATDQWAYYQAKNTRADLYEILLDQWSTVPAKDAADTAQKRHKYEAALESTREKQREIQGEARALEREIEVTRHRANRFDLSEVLFTVALVVTSITLMTRHRTYWRVGIVVAAVGVVLAATAFLIR